MTRLVIRQLRFRRWRAIGVGLVVLATSTSFILLTSAADRSAIEVRGTVRANYRPSYDILVRPRGSFSRLEREAGLVRQNYLSGLFGGITLAEYAAIRRIRGVEVAAPIANLGYVLPSGEVRIGINDVLDASPVQLYRLHLSWEAAGATSHYPGGDLYVYYTRRARFALESHGAPSSGRMIEVEPRSGTRFAVCSGFPQSLPPSFGPFSLLQHTNLSCYSARSPGAASANVAQFFGLPKNVVGSIANATFPVLISAIDPVQERRLLHLDRAIVAGRYLKLDDAGKVESRQGGRYLTLPVIASTRTYVDDVLRVAVERLTAPPAATPARLASPQAYGFLTKLKGRIVARQTYSIGPAYQRMLTRLFQSGNYWTVSSTRTGGTGTATDPLRPATTDNPVSVWRDPAFSQNGGFYPAPLDNRDVQFRKLIAHAGSNVMTAQGILAIPVFKVVGRYNPDRLPGFSPLSRVPLETYYPPLLTAADPRTRAVLKGRPLLPTQNLGDYTEQPPMLLTTLAGIKAFLNPRAFHGSSAAAPLSVIRVRVAGVSGPDTLSEARIDAVAVAIHDRTGLDVDITAGSSPRELRLALPPGRFGRPGLALQEGWVKKGVAVAFLQALDRKTVALFALILVGCLLFITSESVASISLRRRELATLVALGWPRRALFGSIIFELLAIGVVAGAAGVLLGIVAAEVFRIPLPLWRTTFVLPVGLAVTVGGGLVPALLASRRLPVEGARRVAHRRMRVRTISQFAVVNVARAPVRTALAIATLFAGTASLTLLLAIVWAFQGTLVDTLLGRALLVQVRPVDIASAGILIALAAVAIADILFASLRERAAEFAALRACGWRDSHLQRAVLGEALTISLVGGLGGAIAAAAVAIGALSVPPLSVAAAALTTATAALLVAGVAAAAPIARVAKLTPASVLAEE
jgi:putative ABC transport system permease protein